jgi:hypothetical protein
VGRIRFRDESARVEHERVIRAGLVRFDFGQDRVQQIGVMNPRIENFRRRTANLGRDQSQTCARVDRRLVFGEDDQGGARLVQARIHP